MVFILPFIALTSPTTLISTLVIMVAWVCGIDCNNYHLEPYMNTFSSKQYAKEPPTGTSQWGFYFVISSFDQPDDPHQYSGRMGCMSLWDRTMEYEDMYIKTMPLCNRYTLSKWKGKGKVVKLQSCLVYSLHLTNRIGCHFRGHWIWMTFWMMLDDTKWHDTEWHWMTQNEIGFYWMTLDNTEWHMVVNP